MRRTAHRLIAILPVVLAFPLVSQSPARGPTCERGLVIYSSTAVVPVPHDTVRVTLGEQVGGFQRIPEGTDLATLIKRRAAEAGATGLLVIGGGSERDGMQSGGRFLPLFVPRDSARVARKCAALAKRGSLSDGAP